MKGVKLGRTTVFFVVEDFQLVDFWEWASAFIILGSGWLGAPVTWRIPCWKFSSPSLKRMVWDRGPTGSFFLVSAFHAGDRRFFSIYTPPESVGIFSRKHRDEQKLSCGTLKSNFSTKSFVQILFLSITVTHLK